MVPYTITPIKLIEIHALERNGVASELVVRKKNNDSQEYPTGINVIQTKGYCFWKSTALLAATKGVKHIITTDS